MLPPFFSQYDAATLACEQALRGLWRRGKEGELTNTSLDLRLYFLSGSPSTELSDFRQSARSGNVRECKQTLKNTLKMKLTSLLISSSPISIFHRLFRCRYSNSRDVVASSSSLSSSAARATRRACSQATATSKA